MSRAREDKFTSTTTIARKVTNLENSEIIDYLDSIENRNKYIVDLINKDKSR